MLDRLASVAITLDKLAITPTHLAEQAQQIKANAGNEVMAELTFRVFVQRIEPASAADQFLRCPEPPPRIGHCLPQCSPWGPGLR
jgi:hypothetical protein